MAREARKIDFNRRREKNVQRVLGRIGFEAGRDFDDLIALADEAFTEKKTGGQFAVMPGRAHRHSDALAAHTDFERFLADENISFLFRSRSDLAAQNVG